MDSSLVNAVTNCPASSGNGSVDKSKEWQMEMLMEKLRCKAGQFKSFFESAKALRMSLLDKRYPVDSMERNQLYKCLDTIQQNIKVTSLQGMVERLESISRQLGLKFMAGPSGLDWFISSDMFYLEVVFETNDTVKDVKIHHEGKVEQQTPEEVAFDYENVSKVKKKKASCEELVSCLMRRDFGDFTAQLEGLASIYQLNAEKKVKCKAFSALQSLEADLVTLSSLQSIIKEPFNLVHKSPVGVLQKRRGGHPMKLTYFVSPYDLLDPVNKVSKPLAVDNLDVGNSVTVCIEGSLSHKLQTSTLITVNTSGKNLVPVYGPLTNQNSANLPACFALKLSRPMPVCIQLVQKIQQVTEIECGDISSAVPLLSLIVQYANVTTSGGAVDPLDNKGLFVVLPDQVHCYFMTENRQLNGIMVQSIPFTHPAHVPQILLLLRQQALLNAIITSCCRPNSSKQVDLEKVTMMEVTPLSYQQVSISLEHPIEESMATAEFDLTDITNVTCKMYNTSQDNHAADYVTKVLQRSLSIPITMRALIRSWHHESNPSHCPETNSIPGGGGSGTGGGPPGGNGGSGGGTGGGGGGGSGPNTNGGGSGVGPGPIEHDIVNIKPDPDMMQTDSTGTDVLSDSNGDCSNTIASSSLSATNNFTSLNKDTESQNEEVVSNAPSSTTSSNSSANNLFNLFTTGRSEKTSLNIGLYNSENSPTSNNNNNNNSCSHSSIAQNNVTKIDSFNNDCSSSSVDVKNEVDRAMTINSASDTSNEEGSSNNVVVDDNDVLTGNSFSARSISAGNSEFSANISNSSSANGSTTSSVVNSGNSNRKRKWKQTQDNLTPAADDDCEIVLDTSSSSDSVASSSATVLSGAVTTTNNSSGSGSSITVVPAVSNCTTTTTSVGIIGNSKGNNDDSDDKSKKHSLDTIGGGEPEAKVAKKSASLAPSLSSTPSSSSQSPSSILLDLENKNLVPPSVSITPITSLSISPAVSGEAKLGIEIIPFANNAVSNSITITPIAALKESSSSGAVGGSSNSSVSGGSSNVSISGRTKSSKSSSSNDDKDRKRKRRKEESTSSSSRPSLKQDPLLRPVSVSIKPADCGSPRPSSPSTARTPVKSMKHSPSPVYSSPKSSPKHGTSSPGSGKPNMSTLKSAVNSPKSKLSVVSKDSNKDKDRKSSTSGHQSPKLKSSSVKLKQLDLNSSEFISSSGSHSGGSTPPLSSSGDSKSQLQVRNRKGSLSAVIDKLKSAQHCTDSNCGDGNGVAKSSSQSNNISGAISSASNSNKDRNLTAVGKSGEKNSLGNKQVAGDCKVPGEYMVKHSSDGMKITINKTRTKDSSKSLSSKTSSSTSSSGNVSNSTGSGSPKTHTGLKPGVNSGPASKKPQQTLSKLSGGGSTNKTASKVSKNISPSNPGAKNLKTSLLASKDSKQRTIKSTSGLSSSSSIFSKNDNKKLSPTAHRDKDDKSDLSSSLSGILPAQLLVEGLVKPFDPNFQIPKLSARTSSLTNSDCDSKKCNDNNVKNLSTVTDLSLSKQSSENKSSADHSTDSKILIPGDGRNDLVHFSVINSKKDEIVSKSVHDNSCSIVNSSSNSNNNNINVMNSNNSSDSTGSNSGSSNNNNNNNSINIIGSCNSMVAGSSCKIIPNVINSILESSSIDLKKISSAITTPQEAAEILLDISASLPINKATVPSDKHICGTVALPLRKNTPPPPPPPPPPPLPPLPPPLPIAFPPASPSVQVHIVKSPAPSPLIIPSPHSASPCITDDELMDEALVGIGK